MTIRLRGSALAANWRWRIRWGGRLGYSVARVDIGRYFLSLMGIFRRTRYVAGVFWQFRYYVFSTALALVFWDTPFIKPFKF